MRDVYRPPLVPYMGKGFRGMKQLGHSAWIKAFYKRNGGAPYSRIVANEKWEAEVNRHSRAWRPVNTTSSKKEILRIALVAQKDGRKGREELWQWIKETYPNVDITKHAFTTEVEPLTENSEHDIAVHNIMTSDLMAWLNDSSSGEVAPDAQQELDEQMSLLALSRDNQAALLVQASSSVSETAFETSISHSIPDTPISRSASTATPLISAPTSPSHTNTSTPAAHGEKKVVGTKRRRGEEEEEEEEERSGETGDSVSVDDPPRKKKARIQKSRLGMGYKKDAE